MEYLIKRKTKEHRISIGATFVDAVRLGPDWRIAIADADGWINHDGMGRPLPLDAGVEYRLRSGRQFGPVSSRHVAWRHYGHADDVVAYRPILADKPAEPSGEPGAPEWDGEWKPGDRCRWQEGGTCRGEHTILASDGDMHWIRDDFGGYDMASSSELFPIRTAAQRAEDEAVEAMMDISGGVGTGLGVSEEEAKAIYRAIRDGKIPGVKLEGSQ